MDIDKMLAKLGLSAKLLEDAECYYVDDDGVTIVAEYNKSWRHSSLPGAPRSRVIGASSMHDGQALIVRW